LSKGDAEGKVVGRRLALTLSGIAALSWASPASAGRARGGALPTDDDTKEGETREERKERKRREREEYRAKAAEMEAKAKALSEGKEVKEAEMGSNLRGDYYYPTARKRYLPRIKLAYDTLEQNGDDIKALIAAQDKVDVAGPMQLYVSALSGGGLSISASFMSSMKAAGSDYEVAYRELAQVLKKKNKKDLAKAVEKAKQSLLAYREAGKPVGLTGDDWGVGEIPDCKAEGGGGVGKMSKCAVGSSFGNANPNLYNRNIKNKE